MNFSNPYALGLLASWEPPAPEKKGKHGPVAQSCRECRRRKMKCDRGAPCAQCVRRHCEELCIKDPESPPVEAPPPQRKRPWSQAALNTPDGPALNQARDLEAIYGRLARLEAYLGFVVEDSKPSPEAPILGSFSRPAISSNSVSVAGDAINDTEDTTRAIETAAVASEVFGYTTTGTDEQIVQALGGTQLTPFNTCIQVSLEEDILGTPGESMFYMLGVHASKDQIMNARRTEVERLCQLLPNQALTDIIFDEFFSAPDWMFSCVVPEIFKAEVVEFWKMLEDGTYTSVDPLFLAVYFMVAALAIEGYFARTLAAVNQSSIPVQIPSQFARQPGIWSAAAERALQIAHYTAKPRIRTIQTIILFGQYSQLTGASERPAEYLSMLAVAIRISTLFGLHRLGNDPERMPPDDPALPRGSNSMKRQMALRIFGIVCFLDFVHVSSKGRTNLLHPRQIDTEPPMNANQHDLSLQSCIVPLHSSTVLTSATHARVRHKVALLVHKQHDYLLTSGRSGLSHQMVQDLDQEYQEILDGLPSIWVDAAKPNASAPPQLSDLERYEMYSTLDHVYNRTMRLNRPYLLSKLPQHHNSVGRCIRSADVVLRSIHAARDLLKFKWQTYSHALGASIVLFFDYNEALKAHSLPEALFVKKQVLNLATEIFAAETGLEKLNTLIRRGSYVVSALSAGIDRWDERGAASESFSKLLNNVLLGLSSLPANGSGSSPNTYNGLSAAHNLLDLTNGGIPVGTNGGSHEMSPMIYQQTDEAVFLSQFLEDLDAHPGLSPGWPAWIEGGLG